MDTMTSSPSRRLEHLRLPDVSTAQAILFSMLICTAYVLAIYIDPNARLPSSIGGEITGYVNLPTRMRIRARIRAASISTAAIMTVMIGYLYQTATNNPDTTTATSDQNTSFLPQEKGWLSIFLSFFSGPAMNSALGVIGLSPSLMFHLKATLHTLVLLSILFAGPLFKNLYLDQEVTWLSIVNFRRSKNINFWRVIVVGPVTEELVFRACVLPLHMGAYFNPSSLSSSSPAFPLIILPPMIFGIAHINHLLESYLDSSRENPFVLLLEVMRTLAQFTFTTLFGAFASFVFLRTRSVVAATAAHAFCNALGLPSFGPIVKTVIIPPQYENGYERLVEEEQFWWTLAHRVLLIGGLVAFVVMVSGLKGDGWI